MDDQAELIGRLEVTHLPNTPRTHDSAGREVHEPEQCRRCWQSYPCETRRLLGIITDLQYAIIHAADEMTQTMDVIKAKYPEIE